MAIPKCECDKPITLCDRLNCSQSTFIHNTKPMSQTNNWQYKENFHAIADTGDYDGHYEVTNGDISLCTNDDPEDISESRNALHIVVKALNDSGCKFYVNTKAEHSLHIENMLLRNALEDISESDCDYETVDFATTVHDTECKACIAKAALKSIKKQKNDTTGTNKR